MAIGITEDIVQNRSYYMDTFKFIRDPVHNYVYLTKFELNLIDTPEFQRLKDIRQLTCQNVYPASRHTRFEHSLGVMELTRRALRALNQNGILLNPATRENILFNDTLVFNATLAALLHDIGHCPFSHLGEVEFDKNEVKCALEEEIATCPVFSDTTLLADFRARDAGSSHERMSCAVILQKLYQKLIDAGWTDETGCHMVDFELILRSILGLPYPISSDELYQKNKWKNVIVELINSKIFDMDKLDYIMRDALSTGIGTPTIDTHRLFNNMYIYKEEDFKLIFLHRAVPALQNMIEARDSLYMYVYNHHVTVFSDFMYSYIFRRLAHNAEAFKQLLRASVSEESIHGWEQARAGDENPNFDFVLSEELYNPNPSLCLVPKSYLFSPPAILEQYRSDSDMVSLLHEIDYLYSNYFFSNTVNGEEVPDDHAELKRILEGEVCYLLQGLGFSQKQIQIPELEINLLIQNIHRAYKLIHQYQRRAFLKPWWKTSFEYQYFIEQNFRGSEAFQYLGDWVCNGSSDIPSGDEFRSQLAKHVIFITRTLWSQYGQEKTGLLEPLNDGDFFVIQRSSHFFDKDTISNLSIALKHNEILVKNNSEVNTTSDYFVDTLIRIFPQRNYYDLYDKNTFYIFSKPLGERVGTDHERKNHYELIQDIFVFVAKKLTSGRGFHFQDKFVTPSSEEIKKNENISFQQSLEDFAAQKSLKKEGATA